MKICGRVGSSGSTPGGNPVKEQGKQIGKRRRASKQGAGLQEPSAQGAKCVEVCART